jgi:hypothetical protein
MGRTAVGVRAINVPLSHWDHGPCRTVIAILVGFKVGRWIQAHYTSMPRVGVAVRPHHIWPACSKRPGQRYGSSSPTQRETSVHESRNTRQGARDDIRVQFRVGDRDIGQGGPAC